MVTKPSVKGADNTCNVTAQREWYKHGTKIKWPLGKTEWLLATLTSMEECGQTKVTKEKGPKKCPNSETRSIKRELSHVKTTSQVVLTNPDYFLVFESYTNASNNWPGAVITQDNCRTRLLRPLIWNSLLWTAVQCYITISTGMTCRKG